MASELRREEPWIIDASHDGTGDPVLGGDGDDFARVLNEDDMQIHDHLLDDLELIDADVDDEGQVDEDDANDAPNDSVPPVSNFPHSPLDFSSSSSSSTNANDHPNANGLLKCSQCSFTGPPTAFPLRMNGTGHLRTCSKHARFAKGHEPTSLSLRPFNAGNTSIAPWDELLEEIKAQASGTIELDRFVSLPEDHLASKGETLLVRSNAIMDAVKRAAGYRFNYKRRQNSTQRYPNQPSSSSTSAPSVSSVFTYYCSQLEGEQTRHPPHPSPSKRRPKKTPKMPRFHCNGWASITVSESLPGTARVRITHAFAHVAVFSERASGVGVGGANPLKPTFSPKRLLTLPPEEAEALQVVVPAPAASGMVMSTGGGDSPSTVVAMAEVTQAGAASKKPQPRKLKRKRDDADADQGRSESSPSAEPSSSSSFSGPASHHHQPPFASSSTTLPPSESRISPTLPQSQSITAASPPTRPRTSDAPISSSADSSPGLISVSHGHFPGPGTTAAVVPSSGSPSVSVAANTAAGNVQQHVASSSANLSFPNSVDDSPTLFPPNLPRHSPTQAHTASSNSPQQQQHNPNPARSARHHPHQQRQLAIAAGLTVPYLPLTNAQGPSFPVPYSSSVSSSSASPAVVPSHAHPSSSPQSSSSSQRVLFPTDYLNDLRAKVNFAFAEAGRRGGMTLEEARAFEGAFAPLAQLAREIEERQNALSARNHGEGIKDRGRMR